MPLFNLYVDESCHLENDRMPVMCIGYIKVNAKKYELIKKRFKSLKLKYKNPTEIKWNNISRSRLDLYKALIDFFFQSDLEFRCILIKYKKDLDHKQFNLGSHDNYYYKLIYQLLDSGRQHGGNEYRVFLDIKDTLGKRKLLKVQDILDKKYKGASPFKYFQNIHSNESDFIQLADLFIGAVTFKNRGLSKCPNASFVKIEVSNYLEKKLKHSLDQGTNAWANKFNIFDHQPEKDLK